MKSSRLIWRLLHNVKSTVKISSIFVTFLENINFKEKTENVRKIMFFVVNSLTFI